MIIIGKGLFKRKSGKLTRSQDDSSVEDMRTGPKLRRQSSETNLSVPPGGPAKFMDVAKVINIQRTATEPKQRSKSPFSLFKKPKSRDQSPGIKGVNKNMAVSGSEYEYSESEESYGDHPKGIKKTLSEASYASEGMESEGEFVDLEANMEMIDEYYYGVRVFPGQDPNNVYVGWVTPLFHESKPEFEMKDVRNVVVCTLDQDNQLKTR